MNLYILVEGEETEMQLYPNWLSYLMPELKRVSTFNNVTQNNYYLFSGQGIPSIYHHTANAIRDINKIGKYDYLIIALDAEEITPARRKEKLREYLAAEGAELLTSCQLKIIVHNKCVETWFLGNRKVFKRNPQGEKFMRYIKHYDVEQNDPELMERLPEFKRTAHFHEAYLREMLAEKSIRYRKSRPGKVIEKYYLEEIKNRTKDTPQHLHSFSSALQIFQEIKSAL